MKTSSRTLPAAIAVLAATIAASSTVAQSPNQQPTAPSQPPAGAPPQGQPGGHPQFHFPPPTNLKVLPKDLTGEQVHEIMDRWEGALGARCDTCHMVDPVKKMPNGRPALNFADDSKKEKNIARIMYKMTEDINTNYVSMVENSGQPVTCGTCHRGHIAPEAFVPPKEEHEHHGMPPGQPAGTPPH